MESHAQTGVALGPGDKEWRVHDDRNMGKLLVADKLSWETLCDSGFVSTSVHRQFVQGKEQTTVIPSIVKFVIYGKSGVPIALESNMAYTNTNLALLYQAEMGRKSIAAQALEKIIGTGPKAGQAEVLFPRNYYLQNYSAQKK
jgi:hypothetical protein